MPPAPGPIISLFSLSLLFCGGCAGIADHFIRPPRFPARAARLMEDRAEAERRNGNRFKSFEYTSDGLRLAAYMITPPANLPNKGLVVFIHGLGDQKEAMLNFAEGYAQRGYVAVAPDLRGHGQSQGRYTTFGYRERWDLALLLDLLEKENFDVSRVGALGGSLGAAAAIQWAGADSRVKAVVAVAPFAELRSEAEYIYAQQQMQLSSTQIYFVESAVQWEGAFRIDDVSPLAAVKRITTPIYFLRGDRDEIIPANESDRLFQAARGPVVIERVKLAGHLDIIEMAGRGFSMRAVEWMDTYVAPSGNANRPPMWVQALPHRNFPGQIEEARGEPAGSSSNR